MDVLWNECRKVEEENYILLRVVEMVSETFHLLLPCFSTVFTPFSLNSFWYRMIVAFQELPLSLLNLKVHTRVHRSPPPPLDPVLNHFVSVSTILMLSFYLRLLSEVLAP